MVYDEQDVQRPRASAYGGIGPVTVDVAVRDYDGDVATVTVYRCHACPAPATPVRGTWGTPESCSDACQRTVDDAVDNAVEREWC